MYLLIISENQGRRNSIISGEAVQVKERTSGGKFQKITLVNI